MFIALPLMRARARQYFYPACLAAVLLCAVILLSPLFPTAGDSSITALDVGQGLSVVINADDHVAVVDCGSAGYENPGAIAHGHLLSQGRTVIDLLILTHFHLDHVSGVEYLLTQIDVSALAIPDPDGSYLAEDIIELARRRGTDIIYVTETLRVELGDMTIILYPPMGMGDANETGLTVLALGNVNALITGDMNATSERALLRFAALPHIDLLVVGHHGSRHSTSEELLAAVMPKLAVISVGHNNYGHPSDETLKRLDSFSVAVYRTDIMGNVTVNGR
jgi:competence protein ComEC